MNQHPILFSTLMVQAILEGRKTKTRRILKLKHLKNETPVSIHPDGSGKGWVAWIGQNVGADATKQLYPGEQGFKCPYGLPGDILWVRETMIKNDGYTYWPVADGYKKNTPLDKTIPSIFMPFAACRLFLKILSIKVERLQDITGDDVLSEGVDNGKSNKAMGIRWENMQRMAFQDLWQKINGPKSWLTNPWVWVIEFERTTKP